MLTAIRGLVAQLSASPQPPTPFELDEIISSPTCRVVIGDDDDDRISRCWRNLYRIAF